MIMTLIALVLALLFEFFTPESLVLDKVYTILFLLTGGTTILFAALFINVQFLAPIQQLEQSLVPNLAKLLRKDMPLRLNRFILFGFPLFSYAVALTFAASPPDYKFHLVIIWFFLFGFALDLLRETWTRFLYFLSPSFLVDHFEAEAKEGIRNDKEDLLWESLDNLSEISLRSAEKSQLAISTQAIRSFPPVMHTFFEATKSISHVRRNDSIDKKTGLDETSYTLFYLLQRLELIYDKALKNRLETVCRQMIISLGKIITYSGQFDLSLVSFPTHFLTKFGLKGQQHHFQEVAVLTTSTLLEIAKTLVTEVDLTYEELKQPFQSIINGLEAVAKHTFKKNKSINIQTLILPLKELRELFSSEKMLNHQDTPAVVENIDRVLAEFEALKEIMQGIPSFLGAEELTNPELT